MGKKRDYIKDEIVEIFNNHDIYITYDNITYFSLLNDMIESVDSGNVCYLVKDLNLNRLFIYKHNSRYFDEEEFDSTFVEEIISGSIEEKYLNSLKIFLG